jgi:hypothetical protein
VRIHQQLSRFLFGFTHAEHPLTATQRARYDTRVRELAAKDRWGQLTSMLPGFAGIAAIPVWIALQKQVSFPIHLGAQVLYAIGVLIYALWLLRWKHLRHGPRALRELGFADVCAQCGYDLSRQPQPEGRCPECGEAFSRFLPDKTATTDQR